MNHLEKYIKHDILDKKHDEYTQLDILEKESNIEFKLKLCSILSSISKNNEYDKFIIIIDKFKQEFIKDGYLYTEFFNSILKSYYKLYKNSRYKILSIYKTVLFICKFGDKNSLEIIKSISSKYKEYPSKFNTLNIEIERLQKNLSRSQLYIENNKLDSIYDINSEWID